VTLPPQTHTEEELAEVWRELLGVERVGSQDGFFALGGHSLLAVRLFDEIDRRLGARLPLATLFDSDTLADLAAAIDRERATSRAWSPIVTLQAGGRRPPLYVVSLGNRNSDFLPYRQLIEQLGLDQPVYGLQSPGMDGRTLPLGTVEELAAHYVRELRAFQPNGPYLLLGLTFAGVVAYEVARQLEALGEPPVLVAVINTGPYNTGRRQPQIVVGDAQTWRVWAAHKIANGFHRLGIAYYDLLVRTGRQRPRRSPWDLQFIASSRARQRYVAPPSGLRLDWFGTRSPAEAEYAARWEPLVASLEFHGIVGTERDRWQLVFLTRPHVEALATGLRDAIDARTAERSRA
jgi:thioesterase domain-containing protein/acyl carrier protein